MRPLTRVLPFVSLLAACATTQVAAPRGPEPLRAPGPTAPASECRVFAGRPTYALDLGENTERQVLGLACYDVYERTSDISHRAYVQLHARFDDRLFDPLTAALMVVACAGDGACRADGEPESLGQMVHYAQTLRPQRVQAALQQMPISFEVQRTFVARVEASRETVLREAQKLDVRRHKLYVELPAQVHARQAAHWRTFASYYERLDALLPRLDPALKQTGYPDKTLLQLGAEAAKLRDDYLAKCAARSRTAVECATGPIARPLTQRLVQLAIRENNPLLARAEHALLGLGPDQSNAAAQILLAMKDAVDEEQDQHVRWTQALEGGLDEETLATAYGTPPPADVPDLAWEAPRDLVGFRNQLRQLQPQVETVRGTVRFVRPHGDDMEVYFYDEELESVDCTQLQPEELSDDPSECQPDSTRKVRVPRVVLAMADARPILIGNRLEAVVEPESRKGLAVQVFKSRKADKLVQLRAVRWRQ